MVRGEGGGGDGEFGFLVDPREPAFGHFEDGAAGLGGAEAVPGFEDGADGGLDGGLAGLGEDDAALLFDEGGLAGGSPERGGESEQEEECKQVAAHSGSGAGLRVSAAEVLEAGRRKSAVARRSSWR